MSSPSTSPASLTSPVSESSRLGSLDVIRGVSLLGILLMNIVGMGLPDPAYWDPSGAGGDTGWNLRAWMITSLFFEGTMRAMFSMLFGAGVLLFTSKGEAKEAGVSVADAWYRRTIWLFLFGLVHSYLLLWPGEILYMYGLMGFFLFPLRNWTARGLAILGLGLLLTGAGASLVENSHVLQQHSLAQEAEAVKARNETPTREQTDALEYWEAKEKELKPDEATRQAFIDGVRGGYFSAVVTKAELSFMMQTMFHLRYSYFDILGMMLLGMAAFKWRILQAERSTGFYLTLVVVGYGIGLPVNWHETMTYHAGQFSVLKYYEVGLTYDLGRLSTMTGHIGLIMLFCRSGLLSGLRRALGAVGRMALTNYISQTLITTTVFVLFRQFGQWERHQLYFLVFGIWAFQLLLSPWWLARFYFGPMEWLWRSLTYWRRQPFRRSPAGAGAGAGGVPVAA